MKGGHPHAPLVEGRVFGVRELRVEDLEGLARTCTVRGPRPGFTDYLAAEVAALKKGGHASPLALYGSFTDARGCEVLQIALVGSWRPGCVVHGHGAHYVLRSICSSAEPATVLSLEEVARLRAVLIEVSATGPVQGGVMFQAS